jgi:hypothetical protein
MTLKLNKGDKLKSDEFSFLNNHTFLRWEDDELIFTNGIKEITYDYKDIEYHIQKGNIWIKQARINWRDRLK